jgi:hypothetical protein
VSLLAIAYPQLNEKDFQRIENYRMDHDYMFHVVRPHFTFVFHVNDFSTGDFSDEIKKQLDGMRAISFCLRSSLINKDDFKEYYHAFLAPQEGYSDIVKLHDRLYSGKLSKHHRHDIGFIPHITIGNSTDEMICRKMVDAWNAESFSIRGVISSIDIIEYENEKAETIEKINLESR